MLSPVDTTVQIDAAHDDEVRVGRIAGPDRVIVPALVAQVLCAGVTQLESLAPV